jgi:asparagine synthase (glutamine-hydrolysing)
MCGIVAWHKRAGGVDPILLERATSRLAHCGPDGSGIWISPNWELGFGHRRLPIIDQSSAGLQPMRDAAQGLTLTFNGEIYNFKELKTELSALGFGFTTATDTEVILKAYAAWGCGLFAPLVRNVRLRAT